LEIGAMIRVSITSLVLVLVGTSAGLVLLLWFFGLWWRNRAEARFSKQTKQCPLCFFEFTNENTGSLAPCPRCGAPTDFQ
jgi:hypothetical protein